MKRNHIGAVLIVLGVAVFAFPFLRKNHEEHRQREILEEWKQGIAVIDLQEDEESKEAWANETEIFKDVAGVLKIEKIDLEQPILKGATEQNLSLSLATIEPTGTPGEKGNFAIAGHNSRTYGRQFNRLWELESGDEITVETDKGEYVYEVTELYIVEANEVWVLEDTLLGAEITLVTCYYPKEGETQRLIVKGMMKDTQR